MASPEPSPKRQRLSPPGDGSPPFAPAGTADSAYASSIASQANGISPLATAAQAPAMSPALATVTEAQEPSSEATPNPTSKASPKMKEEDNRQTGHERIQDSKNPSPTEHLPFLNKTSHSLARPHPTQNLVSMYSLSELAATVARRDPVSGAKINKLRKSYEGKVKKQDLPGRNKPTVVEGELMGFMEWPEEGWYDQRIYGRELEHALDPQRGRLWRSDDPSASATAKLERALQMNPGRLPREHDEKWRATLALDEPAAVASKPGSANLKQTTFAPTAANPLLNKPGLASTSLRASAPASPLRGPGGEIRPDRAGKKRRYDDASFEGYETGWAEDDGYSTGGGGGHSSKNGKRRRVSVGVQ